VIYGQWHYGEDPHHEGIHPPPSPTKIENKPPPPPTYTKAHVPDILPPPPPFDPVRKRPEATRLSRPLNQPGSGTQQPASEMNPNLLPPPARVPSAPNTGFAPRPNGGIVIGSELSSNTVIFKPPTSNAPKDTPVKSDDDSEQSENLVALNKIFGRLGSIAAAGSATNSDG